MVIRTGKKLQKAIKERTSTLADLQKDVAALKKKVEILWREREDARAAVARELEALEVDIEQAGKPEGST